MYFSNYPKTRSYLEQTMGSHPINCFQDLGDRGQVHVLNLYIEEMPSGDFLDFLSYADKLNMLQPMIANLFSKGIEGRNELGRYLVLVCRAKAIDYIDALIDEVRSNHVFFREDDLLERHRYLGPF